MNSGSYKVTTLVGCRLKTGFEIKRVVFVFPMILGGSPQAYEISVTELSNTGQ